VSDAPALSFPQCYVCGADNPVGLHVTYVRDGDEGCRAEYLASHDHVGWPGLIHGGLLFTLMDEAVAWALIYAGLRGVTAKADVRFRQPVAVGSRLTITGTVLERTRRVVPVRALISLAENPSEVVAELNATMVLADVGRPSDA
jgi:acyl-coenzyme A thioesterase PaaI-like protein